MNRSITTSVSEREVRFIDDLVKNGDYCSRSDAIRSFVRCCIVRIERGGEIIE